MKIIVENRKARFEYEFLDTYEAGIVLVGSEVKSLRVGQVNISENHVEIINGEVFLYNASISPYPGANRFNHEQKRVRKLLLTKKQIGKLYGESIKNGNTLVVTKLFFNDKNIAKATLCLAKGKQLHDKRQDIKKRDLEREQRREGW